MSTRELVHLLGLWGRAVEQKGRKKRMERDGEENGETAGPR